MSEPPKQSVAAPSVVAAFDVDGTLTTRDCVLPFLRFLVGTPRLIAVLAGRVHRLAPAALRWDRDTLKEEATAAVFTGRRAADVADAGVGFADRIADSMLRHGVVAELLAHRRRGDEVVLVSASYGVYLRPLATRWGVTDVVATELEVAADGTCTGALAGGNCRGPAKLRRLRGWLDERHGGRGNVTLWAYGDSAGDLPMLDDADHPIWVGRRPRSGTAS